MVTEAVVVVAFFGLLGTYVWARWDYGKRGVLRQVPRWWILGLIVAGLVAIGLTSR